ncbi:cache domain-containing protein [uncultured Arcobacter sp.]|uniref:methyl-accepting chemotaxis protein n=1 Tax=uncultured Arcobacter sp. TaxID=165434 RepID=UPI0026398E12|nr:cache domain-containing protein [uncultured Arcobacter sp.]
MLKSLSIKAKLLLIVISSIIVVSVAMLLQSVISLQETSATVIEKFKQNAYDTKEEELKNYVSLAMKTIESYHARTAPEKIKEEVQKYLKDQTQFVLSIMEGEYKKYKGKVSDAELKEIIKTVVESSKYGESGYFWINDFDATIVMHPIKPALNGKNMSDYTDKNGKRIFDEFAKVGKNSGSGFIDYVWPKPGFEKPQAKVSYVKVFEPFNWVIGTGEYVDNVTEKLKEEALHAIGEMKYGKNGYYWINDSNAKMIMHPINASLNGKDLSQTKDTNGKLLFSEMAKVANAKVEGGLVKYSWAKPGKKTPQPKFSYVQKFEAWDWIVGTGVYVDDIEDKIMQMHDETEAQIESVIIRNCIIIFVIMVLLALLMGYLSNKTIFTPLNKFQDGLLGFFKYLNKEQADVDNLDDSANDEIGTMAKIINQNLVKTKSLIKQDDELIQDVTRVVEEIEKGYLYNRVEKRTDNESLQKLQNKLNEMLDNLETNIGKDTNVILDTLAKYGQLDFRDNIKEANGKVEIAVNELATIINDMLRDNKQNGLTLDASSDILLKNVDILNRNSTSTAASLEETAAALEEITSAIVNNTNSISTMASYSEELVQSISVGKSLAESTVTAMDEINDQTEAIADAIVLIDQIAFQTNILSLNAAVEAATAGEAGKGFAVVAQEVRNLASRSADAAKEIKALVENATQKTNAGKEGTDKMIKGYEALNESINKTTETIQSIAESSKEQRAGIEQINDAVNKLDQQTQENVAISNTTHSIAVETDELAKLIVSSANEKEFRGKDSLTAKITDYDAMSKTKDTEKFEVKKLTKRTGSTPAKKEVSAPSKPSAKVQEIKSNSKSDDEWESF